MLRKLIDNRYLVWALMAIPAIQLLWPYVSVGYYAGPFLVDSGNWAVRFLMVTLAITPLSLLFKGQGWVKWLLRRRRWFGVASFAYGALHVGFYVWDAQYDIAAMLFVAPRIYAWPGWVGILVLIPLAMTSNNFSQKLLAASWKPLQRLSYAAGFLIAAHWVLLPRGGAGLDGLIQLGILIGLELYRIGYRTRQWYARRQRAAAA